MNSDLTFKNFLDRTVYALQSMVLEMDLIYHDAEVAYMRGKITERQFATIRNLIDYCKNIDSSEK